MPGSLFLALIHARSGRKLPIAAVLAGLLIFPAVLAVGAESATLAIKVDQVGYPLDGPKVVFVSAPAETFQVRRSSGNAVVFQGKLAPPQADPNTGDQVQTADFSGLRQGGNLLH